MAVCLALHDAATHNMKRFSLYLQGLHADFFINIALNGSAQPNIDYRSQLKLAHMILILLSIYLFTDVFVCLMIWLYFYHLYYLLFCHYMFLFEQIIIINDNNPINNGHRLQANMDITNWEHQCAILLGKALILSTKVQIFHKWQEDKFAKVGK